MRKFLFLYLMLISFSAVALEVDFSSSAKNEARLDILEKEQLSMASFDSYDVFTLQKEYLGSGESDSGRFDTELGGKLLKDLKNLYIMIYTYQSMHNSFYAVPIGYYFEDIGMFSFSPTFLHARIGDENFFGAGDMKFTYTTPLLYNHYKMALTSIYPVGESEFIENRGVFNTGNNRYTIGVTGIARYGRTEMRAETFVGFFKEFSLDGFKYKGEPQYMMKLSANILLGRAFFNYNLITAAHYKYTGSGIQARSDGLEIDRDSHSFFSTQVNLELSYYFVRGGISLPFYVISDGDSFTGLDKQVFFYLKTLF